MKKNSKFSSLYMGIIFFLMYLPVAVVIIFSFNESKLPVRFTGFSLKWYQELLGDSAMIEALGNSLILGVASCLVSAGRNVEFTAQTFIIFFKRRINSVLRLRDTQNGSFDSGIRNCGIAGNRVVGAEINSFYFHKNLVK